MLKFFILGGCAVAMLLTRLIMGLFGKVPVISRGLYYASLAILIIGAGLIGFDSDTLLRYEEKRHWPTVEGRVVTSEVAGTEAIRPLVIYTYSVDGVTFTDSTALQAPMFGNKRKEYEVARDLSGEHPTGSVVTVYYNPTNYQESTLTPEAPWDVYGKIGFGATLFMLGLFGMLLPLKRYVRTG